MRNTEDGAVSRLPLDRLQSSVSISRAEQDLPRHACA